MIEILLLSIITALVCNGLKVATGNEKMILYPVKRFLDKHLLYIVELEGPGGKKSIDIKARKIYYPILYCIKCMPSFYGAKLCILLLPFSFDLIYQIPLVILCASPIATIINQLIIND